MKKLTTTSLLFCLILWTSQIYAQCNIESFTVFPLDTENCTGEIADLEFDFEATNFGEQGFCVTDGTSTLCYEIGGDYSFSTVSTCSEGLELTIYDIADSDCSVTVSVDPVCCPCVLSEDYSATASDCFQNNLVNITHSILAMNGSCTWGGWTLEVENQIYDVDWVGNNYISNDVAVNTESSTIELLVCNEISGELECYSAVIDNPCYSGSDCQILSLDFGDNPVCENGLIVTEWLISAENSSEVGFDIFIDGEFQFFVEYESDNWYDFDLEAPNTGSALDEVFELTICDNDNADCCSSIDIENPCYNQTEECLFSDITTETTECENGETTLVVDFNYTGTTNDFYDYTIYGENEVIAEGFAGFTQLPLTIVITNSDVEYFVVEINENDNPQCNIFGEVLNPCFEQSEDCFIGDVLAEMIACEGDAFDVLIDFEFANTSDQFIINGNGNSYGAFSYTDLPIILTTLAADCNTDYEFTIHDVENNDCTNSTGIGVVCCEEENCEIVSIDFTNNPFCEDGYIITEWYIFSENSSEVGFDIYIDEEFLTFVQYDGEGPYDFELPAPDGEEFTITACDNDNADCCYSWVLGNPCFEQSEDCFIGDVLAEMIACEGDAFDVLIDFEFANTSDQFIINGNGNSYGAFSYTDLPIILTTLAADCNTDYEFTIHDVENNDCTNSTGIGVVCCEEENCEIVSIDFTNNPFCEDGYIITEWYIFSENSSEVGFDIYIDEEFLTFVEYDGEGPYDFELPAPDGEEFTITACDNDNADCCYSWVLGNPCFENTNECIIGDVVTEVLTCEDGLFDLWINFEHLNTTNQFSVVGNGNNYGTFTYADLPITLTGLAADCELEYEFIVEDLIQEGCMNFAEVGVVCCEEVECQFTNLEIETSECENGQFDLIVNFEFEGVTNDSYDYLVYDDMDEVVAEGVAPFDQSSLTILMSNTDSEYFVISIFESNNDGCTISGELINPCFEEPGECQMTTLDFGQSPTCENGLITTEWLIDGENTSEVGYDIFINGTFELFVAYEEDSWYDFDIVAPDTEFFSMTICDTDNADCCIAWELENPCYDSNAECSIGGVEVEVVSCGNELFNAVLNFEYENTGDSFTVVGNGISYGTFAYSELPIELTELEANCDTEYEFVIEDTETEACTGVVELGTVCCENFNQIFKTSFAFEPDSTDFIVEIYVDALLLGECTIDVIIDGQVVTVLGDGSNVFSIGPFECGIDQVMLVEFYNNCTGESTSLVIDLSDVQCVTAIDEEDISQNIEWNSYSKILSIKPWNGKDFDVQIFTMDGRVVMNKSAIQREESIELSYLNTGIYFIRVVQEGHVSFMKKIFNLE